MPRGGLRAAVNREKCNGCETCADICPDVFVVKDELAVVKLDPVPAEFEGCAIEARDECMAGAIKIIKG